MTATSIVEKRRMLEIKNLSVSIEDKLILDNLSLSVNAGEVAAIMGPNGSGKSTLAYVLAGKPAYKVISGEILLDGENLLELQPNERALEGLFLAFQYPVEIPGVAAMTFLKAALNAQRRPRGESDLTTPDFMRLVREAAQELKIDQEMLRRALNVGFSGGEKKRFEVLQMALLAPRVSVLDETDSGLDIDALQSRRRRRQRPSHPKARFRRDHALSAAFGPHQAGCRACDGQRPDCRLRRSGACTRARAQWLSRLRRGGRVSRR